MTPTETLVRDYIQTWNETDPTRRRAAIERLYAPDAHYTDPLCDVAGWDGIDAAVAGAQQKVAGLSFSLAGPVDTHHDVARFTWHVGAPGSTEPLVIGFDVAVIDDGRLRGVYGFFDKVPAAV